MKRSILGIALLAAGIAACTHSPGVLSPQPGGSALSIGMRDAGAAPCDQRVNDTPAKLLACIRRDSLWRHLSQFQQIADAHPGSLGHGNRNTGTPGYKASVAYVAGLMRSAGYRVTIQPYVYTALGVSGVPEFAVNGRYAAERDWFAARGSAGGTVTAAVRPPNGSSTGCSPDDYAGFVRGDVALVQRGDCAFDRQVSAAQAAGAAAVVLYGGPGDGVFPARLSAPARIPVIGLASNAIGAELLRAIRAGSAPVVRIAVRLQRASGIDYNLIADSPFGDPNRVVVVDAHLDSIFGAGMLDNASGSTTILEIALNMAKTPTRNRLRYIWFGGEELGLLGSHYYTNHLTPAERKHIAFDLDVDVTATPNFDILVADPAHASNVKRFPPNVVPESRVGNDLFADYFARGGVISRPAGFGNDGTDSNSFSLLGVPNTGILTQQDCCKHRWETRLWGGFLGNYEGKVPSFNGGCVDMPHRWCDNLSNNDPFVLELASKATAFVTFELANDSSLPAARSPERQE